MPDAVGSALAATAWIRGGLSLDRFPAPSALGASSSAFIAAMQQCIAVMQQASMIPLVYQNI
jgi:hypothetical protein